MDDKSFNKLSTAEAERLALLLEELGEAQQIIGKILRHGYESTHPKYPNGMTNRQLLEVELGDVLARVQLMCNYADIDWFTILEASGEKYKKRAYLHHQIFMEDE